MEKRVTRMVFMVCLESLREKTEPDTEPVFQMINREEVICTNKLTLGELRRFFEYNGYSMIDFLGANDYDPMVGIFWRILSQNNGEILIATEHNCEPLDIVVNE